MGSRVVILHWEYANARICEDALFIWRAPCFGAGAKMDPPDPLMSYRQLLEQIERMRVQGRAVPPLSDSQRALLSEFQTLEDRRKSPAFRPLTRREREVAKWMFEGKTNPEIGIILGISPRTVDKHRQNLYAKLGVANRVELIRVWEEIG